MDDFLKHLSSSGDGAQVSDMFLVCIAYADDLTLMSATVAVMQRVLKDVCDYFASQNSLQCVSDFCEDQTHRSIVDQCFKLNKWRNYSRQDVIN